MDQYEEKALKDIEQCGCHILHIMEEDEYPGFSYSIGIEKTSSQPEIIITGLNQEVAHWIANEYNNRVKAGEIFKPGEYYSDFLEGFDISISQANDLIMSARVRLGIIPEEDEIIVENEEGDGQNNETDNIVNVID